MTNLQKTIIGNLILSDETQKEFLGILDIEFFDGDCKSIIEVFKNAKGSVVTTANFENQELRTFLVTCMSTISLSQPFGELLALLKDEYIAKEFKKLVNLKDIGEAKARILEIEEKGKILDLTKPKSLSEVLSMGITESINNPFDLETVPKTGFKDFDYDLGKSAFGGFLPGQLVTVGAYSGGGKSTFLISLLKNIAFEHETLMFSLEMDNITLSARILASLSGVNFKLCLNLGNDKVQQLIQKLHLGEQLNQGILDSEKMKVKMIDNELDLGSIKATIRKQAKESKLRFVFIDYLQLIRPENSNKMRHLEVAEITRELKLLAKELKITIIQLAQLSRATLTKDEPQLNDLRESGSIEADSDTVLLIYQDKSQNRWVKIAKDRTFGKYHKAKLNYNNETQSYV